MTRAPQQDYGRIRDARQLGALCRSERQRHGLTLDQVYSGTGLTTRFLSEFERGKEHASVSRALLAIQSLGLDVLVGPRTSTERLLQALASERDDE